MACTDPWVQSPALCAQDVVVHTCNRSTLGVVEAHTWLPTELM